MAVNKTITTKILEGVMSLQVNNIVPGTVTINGETLDTDVFTVNHMYGTIERVNKRQVTRESYTINFDYNPRVPDYAEKRRERILTEWAIPAQLEAITEALETPSRPDKLNQLLADIEQVRTDIPKP
jgi:hypothetical protein